jgi:hypothetical protein
MKGKKLVLSIVAVVVMAGIGFAQMSGRGMNRKKGHLLNVNNPTMIEGTIVKVETLEKGIGRYGTGVHLVVKHGKKESQVHLGPKGYIDTTGWTFKKGDNVKMSAFTGTYNDSPVLFASEITTNGKTLVLRDKQGFPQWRASNDPNLRGQGRNRKGMGRGKRGFKRGGRGNCRRAG